MLTTAPASWTVRGATFVLWALVGLSALYWVLKVAGGTPAVDARTVPPRAVAAADPAAVARLLGSTPAAMASPAPPALATRFQLVGVVAGVSSGGGAAVIALDGKPARPYRVGTVIDEGLVLQSVQGRSATIAAQRNGPPLLVLELPPLRQANQAATAAPR